MVEDEAGMQRAGDFRVYAIAEGTATPSDKASAYVRISEEDDVQLFAQAEFTPIVAGAPWRKPVSARSRAARGCTISPDDQLQEGP